MTRSGFVLNLSQQLKNREMSVSKVKYNEIRESLDIRTLKTDKVTSNYRRQS